MISFIHFDKQSDIYLVTSSKFLASSAVLTRVNVAFINGSVTQSAGIARVTVTGEVVNTIDTNTIETEIVVAIILVNLTSATREASGTVAGEGVEAVLAHAAVVAGAGGAVVNVALTVCPREPVDTGALIAVDTINTNTIISAGITGALVNINLTVLACVT